MNFDWEHYRQIGCRIRDLRTRKGMTQAQLAEATNMSVDHLKHAEVGDRKLSLEKMDAVAEVLGETMDYLIHGNDGSGRIKEDSRKYAEGDDREGTAGHSEEPRATSRDGLAAKFNSLTEAIAGCVEDWIMANL